MSSQSRRPGRGSPALTGPAWSRPLAEGRPEPGLAHPPEVDLHAVHQRHRDLVPVLAQVLRRGGDIPLLPADAEITGHPLDHRARVVAEMAARPGEQRDAVHSRHFTSRRSGVRPTAAAGPAEAAAARGSAAGPLPTADPAAAGRAAERPWRTSASVR